MIDDGVIKYDRTNFTESGPLDATLWKEIESWREKLFKLNLIGEYPTEKVGFGNLSKIIKWSKKAEFIITGTQTGKYAKLSGDHYTLVTGYDLEAMKLQQVGPLEASSEALTHAAVYEANKSDAEDDWNQPGTGSFLIGLEMAQILAELQLDEASILAAILYRVVREGRLSLAQVRKDFDDEVATLIEGVLRMAAISAIQNASEESVLGQREAQIDNLRKMLVSVIDDVRVALIKLAERTAAIRAVKDAPEQKRIKVAREVFNIYAPLAHRLGNQLQGQANILRCIPLP